MNLLLRCCLPALTFAGGIAASWDYLVESLGQGAHVLAAGGFGILLGATVIGMGVFGPIAGLAASLAVAFLLRDREPIAAGSPRSLHVHLVSLAAFAVVVPAVSMAMWRLATPQASEYAHYGRAFFVTSSLLGLSFCIVGAMFTASTLLRQPLLAKRS